VEYVLSRMPMPFYRRYVMQNADAYPYKPDKQDFILEIEECYGRDGKVNGKRTFVIDRGK